MSLRTRLIVAFFVLSVVPLAAVTTYSYYSNVKALRQAAERETDLLAGELGQRMQLVTAQLTERVEHLMDLSEIQAQADARASELQSLLRAQSQQTAPVQTVQMESLVATALGDAAMLLNNVDLRGLRSRPTPSGSGRSRAQGSSPAASASGAASATGQTGVTPAPAGQSAGSRTTPGARVGSGRGTGATVVGPPPPVPAVAGVIAPPVAEAPTVPVPPGAPAPGARIPSPIDPERMLIDLAPFRRELLRELVPEGELGKMTAEERARLGRELNARMLGVAEGIRLGAAELQKRAEAAKAQADAQQAADTRATAGAAARAAAAPRGDAAPPITVVSLKPAQRRTAITGNKLGVTMERDGQVVGQVQAEINLPNVLATVFSTTRRDRGEVPFAVTADGVIHAPTDADRVTVAGLGDVVKPGGPQAARVDNWVVVTTTDPSGGGVRLGIARPVGDSLNAVRRTTARNAGLGLGLIVLALAGIVPLSTRLTRHLSSLGEGVDRLAKGDYAARVPVKSRDEVGRLATAFNRMAAEVERHQRAAVGQERIRRELELGRQIQNEMLPHAPLRMGLTEIRGVSVPAREVGGDFFNYFELPDGRLAMLVGDVSGKGVGAALLMANLQASLRTRLALGQDLSAIADAIDRDVDAGSPGPVYATLFVGILDSDSRRLLYVNAGHNPQFILRRHGGIEAMESAGLPVGLLSGRGYREQQVQLAPGDVLFFYTDGCVEAENEAEEMFGPERLQRALLETIQVASAEDVLERVEEVIKAFRGSREPFDDATMMTVKIG